MHRNESSSSVKCLPNSEAVIFSRRISESEYSRLHSGQQCGPRIKASVRQSEQMSWPEHTTISKYPFSLYLPQCIHRFTAGCSAGIASDLDTGATTVLGPAGGFTGTGRSTDSEVGSAGGINGVGRFPKLLAGIDCIRWCALIGGVSLIIADSAIGIDDFTEFSGITGCLKAPGRSSGVCTGGFGGLAFVSSQCVNSFPRLAACGYFFKTGRRLSTSSALKLTFPMLWLASASTARSNSSSAPGGSFP